MSSKSDSATDHESIRGEIAGQAARLFRAHGYAATNLEDIALAAGVSLEECRRHFPNRVAISWAIYAGHVDKQVAFAEAQPAGQLAERYHKVLQHAIDRLSVDRGALTMLFAAAMAEDADLDVMSGALAQRLASAYHLLVLESDDALRDNKALELGIALYTMHMLVVLFWLYDRSPGQASTQKLLRFVHELFRLLRPMFFMPMIPQGIAKLAEIVMPQMVGRSISAAAQENTGDGQQQDLDVHGD